MIALITSTICPPPPTINTLYRSTIEPHQRLNETIQTIESLRMNGINNIFLFDNSGPFWLNEFDDKIKNCILIKINFCQFENKGLSELLLIKSAIPYLPENLPILKISGRYQLINTSMFEYISKYDIVCKQYKNCISTRAYLVKNKNVLDGMISASLNSMLNYNSSIKGILSLFSIIRNTVWPYRKYKFHITVMLEVIMYKIITKNFTIKNLDSIGIKGRIAGSRTGNEYINE